MSEKQGPKGMQPEHIDAAVSTLQAAVRLLQQADMNGAGIVIAQLKTLEKVLERWLGNAGIPQPQNERPVTPEPDREWQIGDFRDIGGERGEIVGFDSTAEGDYLKLKFAPVIGARLAERRRMATAFYSLPYNVRLRIVQELDIARDRGDVTAPDGEMFHLYHSRAKNAGKLSQLADAIQRESEAA